MGDADRPQDPASRTRASYDAIAELFRARTSDRTWGRETLDRFAARVGAGAARARRRRRARRRFGGAAPARPARDLRRSLARHAAQRAARLPRPARPGRHGAAALSRDRRRAVGERVAAARRARAGAGGAARAAPRPARPGHPTRLCEAGYERRLGYDALSGARTRAGSATGSPSRSTRRSPPPASGSSKPSCDRARGTPGWCACAAPRGRRIDRSQRRDFWTLAGIPTMLASRRGTRMRDPLRHLCLAALLWVCGCRLLDTGRRRHSRSSRRRSRRPRRELSRRSTTRACATPRQDAQDWITHGRSYSEQRFSPLTGIRADNVGQLGLAWSFDTDTDRGLEATPLVVDGVLFTTGSWSVVFAIDARTGRQLWKYDPEVPRETGPKGCCDAVNRGVAVYKDKVYVGTLRRAADRARCDVGRAGVGSRHRRPQQALHHHRRAAGRRRQRDHRQRRRRARRARLRLGLRRRNGRSRLALLHRARGSVAAVRIAGARARREDLDGQRILEDRRRRHGVGLDGLRPRSASALRGNRQRLAVEPLRPQPRRRRQSLPVVDPRAAARHRRARLVLPGDPGRHLGLHRDAAHHPRRPDDRRPAAQAAAARSEERLLLRARSRDRRARLGREVRRAQLGRARRSEDRPARRGQGPRLPQGSEAREAGADRRAQLAADVVQPDDGARLHPGAGRCGAVSRREGFQVSPRRLEHRHRPGRVQGVPARDRGRLAAGVGSGAAEGGLARRAQGPVEWRHALDRRQSRLPGNRGRQIRRLRGRHRSEALGGARRLGRGRRADHATASTASSTCR